MKELQLREAKTRLSAVIDAAQRGRPTLITKHGRKAAVVVSYDEWTKLTSKLPTFSDLLLAIPPLEPGDIPERRRPARVTREGGFE